MRSLVHESLSRYMGSEGWYETQGGCSIEWGVLSGTPPVILLL